MPLHITGKQKAGRLAGRDGQTKKDQCFIEKIDNSLRVIVPARSTIPGVVLRVRKMGNSLWFLIEPAEVVLSTG